MTGCTVRRYDQLETSPETIEQELQPAVCERRQTDRQTYMENYCIDNASLELNSILSKLHTKSKIGQIILKVEHATSRKRLVERSMD